MVAKSIAKMYTNIHKPTVYYTIKLGVYFFTDSTDEEQYIDVL